MMHSFLRRRCAVLGAALALLAGCARVPRTAADDPTVPQTVLNGVRFHVEEFGAPTAPLLIVLHGGPGADFRYLLGLAALADRYRVLFYDQRGSGLSERMPAATLTPEVFVDDLHAMVQAYGGGRPVHLLGHSWGAMLATAYTSAHPQQVASLVLAEPGFIDQESLAAMPQRGWPGWRAVTGMAGAWIGKWFVATDGDPYARDDWFMQQVLPLMQGAEQQCDGRRAQMQAWRFGYAPFQATVGRMMDDPAWGRTLDFTRGLDRYTGPVLFLRGACNVAQGEAHQRRMMARFPAQSAARLVTLPGAGHFMFNDQPAASLAAVRAFLP